MDDGVTGILIAHLKAFGSGELKTFHIVAQNVAFQYTSTPKRKSRHATNGIMLANSGWFDIARI